MTFPIIRPICDRCGLWCELERMLANFPLHWLWLVLLKLATCSDVSVTLMVRKIFWSLLIRYWYWPYWVSSEIRCQVKRKKKKTAARARLLGNPNRRPWYPHRFKKTNRLELSRQAHVTTGTRYFFFFFFLLTWHLISDETQYSQISIFYAALGAGMQTQRSIASTIFKKFF